MSRFLFLTQRMLMGYGVDLLVHKVAQQLTTRGHKVTVLCNELDETFRGSYDIAALARGTVQEVVAFANGLHPTVITACTSPFFEMLPVLRHTYPAWAWECGDPTPEFFSDDAAERERIRRYKIEFCYPAIDGVMAISEFLRRDIEWPDTRVVYLGCDHAPDFGSKGLQDLRPARSRKLRVGTLMRLGPGEARYKGNGIFMNLLRELTDRGAAMEFAVMGRGSRSDAEPLKAAGCRVHLNATDEEKWDYLRSLDVFISCSLWEGFNLPLVEAQAAGTMALAFDTGAHPEVCPLTVATLQDAAGLLTAVCHDDDLLLAHSRAGLRFVRERFRWESTADLFARTVLNGNDPESARQEFGSSVIPAPAPEPGALARYAGSTIRSLRHDGLGITARKVRHKVRRALRSR